MCLNGIIMWANLWFHLPIVFCHTHSEVSTSHHKRERWCLFSLSNHRQLLQTHTHTEEPCVCVCVFRHAADNVSECVLLTLSIVSSLIISPPPRHGHQLLRGAIIWNWFSPPTRSLAQNIKCSFGNMEEWKVMIKGCQQLKLNSSANICERHLFSSLPFSYCVRLPFAVLSTERLGGKTVGKALLFWAFTCLWVCLEGGGGWGWGGEDDREKKETWWTESLPSYAKPLVLTRIQILEREHERDSHRSHER